MVYGAAWHLGDTHNVMHARCMISAVLELICRGIEDASSSSFQDRRHALCGALSWARTQGTPKTVARHESDRRPILVFIVNRTPGLFQNYTSQAVAEFQGGFSITSSRSNPMLPRNIRITLMHVPSSSRWIII